MNPFGKPSGAGRAPEICVVPMRLMTRRRDERGTVMLLALIMMAVLVIAAAAAVKLSMNSDRVAHNLRSRQLALEAAESALRWCERKVKDDPWSVLMVSDAVHGVADDEWLDAGAWSSWGVNVPRSALTPGSTMSATHDPQCLIRHFTLESWRDRNPPALGSVTIESRGYDAKHFMFYRITARGFSPDWQPASSLQAPGDTRGSMATVQVMIRSIR